MTEPLTNAVVYDYLRSVLTHLDERLKDSEYLTEAQAYELATLFGSLMRRRSLKGGTNDNTGSNKNSTTKSI